MMLSGGLVLYWIRVKMPTSIVNGYSADICRAVCAGKPMAKGTPTPRPNFATSFLVYSSQVFFIF